MVMHHSMRERCRRLRLFFDQHDRVRRNALARAGKAESLLGRRLDADAINVHIHALRQIAAHLRNVRRELRRLCEHRAVYVANRIPFGVQARHHLAQQRQTIRPGKCGILVRES